MQFKKLPEDECEGSLRKNIKLAKVLIKTKDNKLISTKATTQTLIKTNPESSNYLITYGYSCLCCCDMGGYTFYFEEDQSLKAYSFPVTGDRKGQFSISINIQWRICFRWKDSNAYDVEITDYH